MKTRLITLAGMGLLIGAGLIFSCGKAKEALSTPPADQTKIAQDAQAQALSIALGVKDVAMSMMQGGVMGLAPKSPMFQPMDKLEWENDLLCPKAGKIESKPDGCDWALEAYETGSCESLELQMDYADGCTEALVWKEGEGSIKLEVIDEADLPAGTDQGFKLTVSFSDFVEGNKFQDGEMIFSAASAENEQSGELKIEIGNSGYTEDGKNSIGYALMTYSADGTVKKGLTPGTATEANLTMEADITSTDESGTESIDIKYVIASDMSGKPGDSDAGITTIDISGTSSEWGRLDAAGGSLELMAQGMKIDPACSKNPVAGTLGVKGTDENDITYDVLLTFHSTCDGKAQAKITVEGEDVSGTYEGTIPLQSTGPAPEDSILEQLFLGFTDTFNGIEEGLNQL
jgi:hypothetical protein